MACATVPFYDSWIPGRKLYSGKRPRDRPGERLRPPATGVNVLYVVPHPSAVLHPKSHRSLVE